MPLSREQILSRLSGKPPSKRWLAKRDRMDRPLLNRFRLDYAIRHDWFRRLGVPQPTSLNDSVFWNTLAEEIGRWTGVTLSNQEVREISCTDLDSLVIDAVRVRERYLENAFVAAQQRKSCLAKLNATDREAAGFIGKHPGCTGARVAKEVGVSCEHFKRRIVPKLKPFGLANYGGYYMPPLRTR